MPIIYGEAGSGKTQAAIQQIINYKQQQPWQPVWVLLPNELQTAAFRDRLMATMPHKVLFGIHFFTFYQLYRHLLNRALVPYREIGQGGTIQLLQSIIAQTELEYVTPIADKVGFVQLLADLIDELKQSFIQHVRFEDYATTPKDRDIARIYAAYQTYLFENDLVDREGSGWLAHDRLKEGDLRSVGLLVVDGFQQFSPLQAWLLGKVSTDIPNLVFTLTHSPHNRPIHRVFRRTQARLYQFIPSLADHEEMIIDTNTDRHPTLSHLVTHYYEDNAPQILNQDAVHLIEAPNLEEEVRGVLRAIKRRLILGELPDDLIILARDLGPYNDLLRSIAESYGVPLMFKRGIPLQHNPAIRAIMLLLSLQATDFNRTDVLDVLQSPYFRIELLEIEDRDALERVAIWAKVMSTREQWIEAIEQSQIDVADEDGEQRDGLEIPTGLQDRLVQFFERVLPPPNQTVRDYIEWVESLLGPDPEVLDDFISEHGDDPSTQEMIAHFRFFDQVRAQPTVLVRDLEALHSFRRCLREMIEGYQLIEQDHDLIEWTDFYSDLQLSVKQHKARPMTNAHRHHSILVTTAFEGRGLHHDHVYILGLSEGIFPAIKHEDPLYSDRERIAFEQYAIDNDLPYELLVTSERQDDVVLFFECMSMARQTLTLSRPALDEKAEHLPPSMLWNNVLKLIEDEPPRTVYRAGKAPTIADAATLREAEAALVSALVNEHPHTAALEDWMMIHNPNRWVSIQHGYAIEASRENPNHQFDRYAGVLSSPITIEHAKKVLGPYRTWSASQFNDFGYCPFRFFAKRVLKLEELREPEEGFDAAQLGSIQHEILEETYRHVKAQNWPIAPDYLEPTLDVMHSFAETILAAAPRKYGFRRSVFWEREQREIRRRLERFIRDDFLGSKTNPYTSNKLGLDDGQRYIYRLELPFGTEGSPQAILAKMKTIGFIDRIDHIGDQLIVIDYKSGASMPSKSDMESGRNFQMILYLKASQQVLDQLGDEGRVVGGFFWSLHNRKVNGLITADEAQHLFTEAIQKLERYIENGRQGRFPVQPSQLEDGKCYKYCEFYQLCRIQRTRSWED